jgi:hypothetical protein
MYVYPKNMCMYVYLPYMCTIGTCVCTCTFRNMCMYVYLFYMTTLGTCVCMCT